MKVDVIAVIDDILSTPTGMLADEVKQLKRARDRIAELIAAAVKVDALSIQSDAHKELRAALLACKGQDHEG